MLLAVEASAQIERILPKRGSSSLEGTSFVVGFMQNEILEVGADPRIQIFISSQYDAVVKIYLPLWGVQTRYIRANTVHVEDLSPYHVVNVSEFAQRKAIYLESDVPIVVYALNTLAASTDSYTAIPIKHLGTQYLTVNAPSDQYPYNANFPNPHLDTIKRSAEFMVMAQEDYTRVTITPAVKTLGGQPPFVPFNVTLNRGDCYLVKAAWTPLGFGDLSGSRVVSDKPIALLSGHMRSSIPTTAEYSKDHLVEMLPPLNTWGKEYITTPFALVSGGDVVRIMAADVDTRIEIHSGGTVVNQWLTSPGQWRDLNVSAPAYYKSDKAFFVMQFMPSRRPREGTSPNYDPAMVVVPPLEQYVAGALLQTPQLESQGGFPGSQQFFHFVNIVADAASLPTLSISGIKVTDAAPEIKNQSIGTTGKHWAALQISPGVHTITADTGLFSGVMYGTTNADSYANLFGISFDPIVFEQRSPPNYNLTVDCGKVQGVIRDSLSLNGIGFLSEVDVIQSRTNNYRWAISNPIDPRGSIDFMAEPISMWMDGEIVIHAYDGQGWGKEWYFFYDAPNILVQDELVIDANRRDSICVKVPILNMDSTSVRIAAVRIVGDSRLQVGGSPIVDTVIAGKGSLDVWVCFVPSELNTIATGKLIVDLGCGLTKEIDLRSRAYASVRADDLDFGDVRIGDTVCLPVPIVNDGQSVIRIEKLAFFNEVRFYVDTASLKLPIELLPGDTVWVDVCFTPTAERDYDRTDSVVTSPFLGETTTYYGRGVRPDVKDIVIDWGDRRVGTRHDTTGVLNNVGSGSCVVAMGQPVVGDPSFDLTQLGFPHALLKQMYVGMQTAFTPDSPQPHADTIPMIVDWSLHPEVNLILLGQGTMPDLVVDTVDFGNVVLGTTKTLTSIPFLYNQGNERLTIDDMVVRGPDITEFEASAVMGVRRLDMRSAYLGTATFTPSRLGLQYQEIDVVHDGAPSYERRTSTIVLRGFGVDEPVKQLDVSLAAPLIVDACLADTAVFNIANNGTAMITVDSIDVSFDGTPIAVDTLPSVLGPGEQFDVLIPVLLLRGGDGTLTVDLYYEDSIVVQASAFVEVVAEAATLEVPETINADPGSLVDIPVRAYSNKVRQVPELLAFNIIVDPERWTTSSTGITASVTDATGARQVSASVTPTGNGVFVQFEQGVQAPYEVVFSLPGLSLWKDTATAAFVVHMLETDCADDTERNMIVYGALCAGALRMVRLDALPIVQGRLGRHPVGDELDLILESSLSTEVDLVLISATGEVERLASNYRLEKGISHCNFNLSMQSSGYYSLVIESVTGKVILPVVILK